MDFISAVDLCRLCEESQWTIAQVMLRREEELFGRTSQKSMEKMAQAWDIMKDSTEAALHSSLPSLGGLIGGEARLLHIYHKSGNALSLGILHEAMVYAMAVMERNASMGRIVAAPTAGSAGVLPAVLRAVQNERGYPDEKIMEALFVASAIGYLISYNATLAGAEGGCQAEIGSATAMAAAALCYLQGGDAACQCNAAALALGNLLGLVCDPIRGLVEAPCQQRNAQGACTAILSAELSLAGIRSQVELDEMISVMYSVGKSMPDSLRETGIGGMAGAKKFCKMCT